MPITSKQFSINKIDLLKGLITAVLTDVFTIIIELVKKGPLIIDWRFIGGVALAAFLGYILKNFLTPPRIVITEPETVAAVKQGKATVRVVTKPIKKKNG